MWHFSTEFMEMIDVKSRNFTQVIFHDIRYSVTALVIDGECELIRKVKVLQCLDWLLKEL